MIEFSLDENGFSILSDLGREIYFSIEIQVPDFLMILAAYRAVNRGHGPIFILAMLLISLVIQMGKIPLFRSSGASISISLWPKDILTIRPELSLIRFVDPGFTTIGFVFLF